LRENFSISPTKKHPPTRHRPSRRCFAHPDPAAQSAASPVRPQQPYPAAAASTIRPLCPDRTTPAAAESPILSQQPEPKQRLLHPSGPAVRSPRPCRRRGGVAHPAPSGPTARSPRPSNRGVAHPAPRHVTQPLPPSRRPARPCSPNTPAAHPGHDPAQSR
jgi:hypothetical protein